MARFGKRDVTDVLELLEKELDVLPRLERVEKMKLRTKIRRQETFLMTLEDPKPAKVMLRLQGRLAEVFRLYSSSSKEKVGEMLGEKCSKLERTETTKQ